MSELPLGEVTPEDRPAFFEAIVRHFHEDGDGTDLSIWDDVLPLDRAIAVRDGGRIVANFAVIPVDVSVPGGDPIPCAGVTTVGVSPTHRRRGLLRAMMTRGLEQAVEHGEPVAALYASESAIYPRFGFGISAEHRAYHLDTVGLRFLDPADPRLVTEVDAAEAADRFAAVYETVRTTRPGAVGRNPGQWHLHATADPPTWRHGATPKRRVAVGDRGYAVYRVRGGSDAGRPAGTVELLELVAADREAEQALWQHVCAVDLTTSVRAGLRPVDDLLPWLVDDRLRLRAREDAPLYTRILDVPRALASRTSGVTDGLTLRVHDAMGFAEGTYRFDASPEGAACTATDASPDLELGVDALSAVWLGGTNPVQLASAGKVTEHRTGAAATLRRLTATDRAPWTPFEF